MVSRLLRRATSLDTASCCDIKRNEVITFETPVFFYLSWNPKLLDDDSKTETLQLKYKYFYLEKFLGASYELRYRSFIFQLILHVQWQLISFPVSNM